LREAEEPKKERRRDSAVTDSTWPGLPISGVSTKEEDDMGFAAGFMTGMVVTIGLLGFLTYWLCSRPNSVAVAKLINGIAQALAHQNRSTEPLAMGKKAEHSGMPAAVNHSPPRQPPTP
jgi:hypothetical protein